MTGRYSILNSIGDIRMRISINRLPKALITRFPAVVLVSLFALLAAPCVFGQADVDGSKDYPGISRMPGYYISFYEESPFDSFTFKVTENGQEKEQAVEGHRYRFRYDLKENATIPSQLQVVRNYENAARSAGGKVLFDSEEATTLRFAKSGKEVWVSVQVGNRPSGVFVLMVIIEKQGMEQEVTIDAKAMGRDLQESGRVAIYGIHFDTGKAELKPESSRRSERDRQTAERRCRAEGFTLSGTQT